MADKTGIEWTDATWNPVTGCTEVSPGCDRCYAKTFAERWRGVPGHHFEQGFDVVLRPERLDQPLRWKKPRRIFVNSMSDLFHNEIPDEFIAQVFAVMALAPKHTFQVLTKRHGRMRSLLNSDFRTQVAEEITELLGVGRVPPHAPIVFDGVTDAGNLWGPATWPLPNVWLGVSVENQQWADIRIPALADTPAAVRFLSCEPLLGPVDLTTWLPQAAWSSTTPLDGALHLLSQGGRCDHQPAEFGYRHEVAKCRQCTNGRRISWVIAGGESGHGARPMHPAWARSLRDQCTAAGVPFLFKQWGEWQDGSAAPDQRGEDHVIVWDGRHERARDHWAEDEKGRWTSDLIKARNVRQRGSEHATYISRVGKKSAGRELDGRTWDEFPEAVTVP